MTIKEFIMDLMDYPLDADVRFFGGPDDEIYYLSIYNGKMHKGKITEVFIDMGYNE